jgi:hypothetical protein
MKNTYKILINIYVFFMLTQICSASSPYPQLSGNPADPIWTIYLASATLNDNPLQSGDAIGIFDNNRLVGSFELTEVLSQDKQFNNFITVWSTLNDGSGYSGGNTYTIKCWDSSLQKESTSFSIQFDHSVSDTYTGETFPQGDGMISVAALIFQAEESPSGSPFNSVAGDPSQAVWTIYLTDANLNSTPLQINDEIAIFHNNTQVGFYKLKNLLSQDKWNEQYITVWSVLNAGSGYETGQPFKFQLWDDSDQQIYTAFSIHFGQNVDNAYEGQVFPTGESPFSVMSISFQKEIQDDCAEKVLKERLRYDPSGDGKIGLEEAIHALQVMSGM